MPSHISPCARLIGVYTKLKGVGAAINSEEEQQELVEQSKGLVMDICNDHVFAAESFVEDPTLRAKLIDRVKIECQELIEYVVAAKRFHLEINARSKDRVISFGEKLSCLFMATLLQDTVRLTSPLSSQDLPLNSATPGR
jgi:aspartate kinase